jgi:hypothetical protein
MTSGFEDRNVVHIRAGSAVIRCGDDARNDAIWVTLEAPSKPEERVTLPRSSGGVGGLDLVVSHDERHLALFVYSGQSAQGYELFALEPQLRHLGGLPYVHGMGDGPTFSPDDRWLVMLVREVARLRTATREYFEAVSDEHAQGTVVIDWARLYVQRVPDGAIENVHVGVEIALSTDHDVVAEWEVYAVDIVGANVRIRMPWGEVVTVPLPPAGDVTAERAQR